MHHNDNDDDIVQSIKLHTRTICNHHHHGHNHSQVITLPWICMLVKSNLNEIYAIERWCTEFLVLKMHKYERNTNMKNRLFHEYSNFVCLKCDCAQSTLILISISHKNLGFFESYVCTSLDIKKNDIYHEIYIHYYVLLYGIFAYCITIQICTRGNSWVESYNIHRYKRTPM